MTRNAVHRLRDTRSPKNYAAEFEAETLAYWERIKVKILELHQEQLAAKANRAKNGPDAAQGDDDDGDDEQEEAAEDAEEEEEEEEEKGEPVIDSLD